MHERAAFKAVPVPQSQYEGPPVVSEQLETVFTSPSSSCCFVRWISSNENSGVADLMLLWSCLR
jgi:hypothetical protein